MERKFLIIVDMQNDFIDGALGTREAQAIVPVAAQRIKELDAEDYETLVTLDTHEENYLFTNEGKHLPVKHCIYASHGWELHPEIRKAISDCCTFEKETFGSMGLVNHLITRGARQYRTTIEIMGLCTDICVISNALLLKANFPEAEIRVNSTCCAGVTPELHEAALKVMQSCQIEVI